MIIVSMINYDCDLPRPKIRKGTIMKKNLALLFALLLAGQSLIACSDASDTPVTTDAAAATDTASDDATPHTTVTQPLLRSPVTSRRRS